MTVQERIERLPVIPDKKSQEPFSMPELYKEARRKCKRFLQDAKIQEAANDLFLYLAANPVLLACIILLGFTVAIPIFFFIIFAIINVAIVLAGFIIIEVAIMIICISILCCMLFFVTTVIIMTSLSFILTYYTIYYIRLVLKNVMLPKN